MFSVFRARACCRSLRGFKSHHLEVRGKKSLQDTQTPPPTHTLSPTFYLVYWYTCDFSSGAGVIVQHFPVILCLTRGYIMIFFHNYSTFPFIVGELIIHPCSVPRALWGCRLPTPPCLPCGQEWRLSYLGQRPRSECDMHKIQVEGAGGVTHRCDRGAAAPTWVSEQEFMQSRTRAACSLWMLWAADMQGCRLLQQSDNYKD